MDYQNALLIPSPPGSEVLQVLSCGIDWATTTTHDEGKRISVSALARRWMDAQAGEGHKAKPYTGNGFVGEHIEGITLAERDNETMVRLSGSAARRWATVLIPRVNNVSRLDFQVTIRDQQVTRDWAGIAECEVMGDARIREGRTKRLRLSDGKLGNTLYIGRRVSNRFFRVYNKSAESPGDWPDTTWRWEIEFKGPRAAHWADAIRKRPWRDDDSRSVVAAGFRDYGHVLPAHVLTSEWKDKSPRLQTTDERRLAYLGTCIRPMIQKLAEAYGPSVIRKLLDLQADGETVYGGTQSLAALDST